MTPPVPAAPIGAPLVLYDGVCGLCDRTVQILLRLDRRGVLRFAPLQGETARSILARTGDPHPGDTIVFVAAPDAVAPSLASRSSAVLAILRRLGVGWRLLATLGALVPRPLRDAVYDAIAARRYRWFGRRDSCRLPTAAERARFLP